MERVVRFEQGRLTLEGFTVEEFVRDPVGAVKRVVLRVDQDMAAEIAAALSESLVRLAP